MIIKSKLIRLEVGFSINEILTKLKNLNYSKSRLIGIELLDFNNTKIHGRFIEENTKLDNQIDPFGNIIINKITKFITFDFYIQRIQDHQFTIRIDSPPKSLKSFVSILGKSLGFGMSISTIKIDILKFLTKTSEKSNNWIMKKARISGIRLTSSSMAKLEIYSLTNAYLEAKDSLNLQGTVLERAWFDVKTDYESTCFEISDTGLLIGEDSQINHAITIIHSHLTE